MGASLSRDAAGHVELKAMLCPANYYGIAAIKWGVAASPCQACPANTRTGFTSTSQYKASSYYTTADDFDSAPNTMSGATQATPALLADGYYNVTACYTKPGYGYYSGAASICRKGTYNAGNNREPCTRCDAAAAAAAASPVSSCGNHVAFVMLASFQCTNSRHC
jgi:hypothetical protein